MSFLQKELCEKHVGGTSSGANERELVRIPMSMHNATSVYWHDMTVEKEKNE